MKKVTLSLTDKIILSVIILVAALLRLWNFNSIPFMHDEFSALARTDYDNFIDLIREGVIKDSHPPGIQMFLYFLVGIFGWNAFWLKLPFALMGVASVYLVFKIGQQWFNTNVGLISAAFVTVSELFIFYSQLIRPYSPGLFFVLLFVYFWNRILFDGTKPSIGVCIGFALSAWLSGETHMFSLIEAEVIWLTGFFFLKIDNKKQKKAYCWSSIGAILLYAPTIPIFYHQVFVNGGIGGWLSSPKLSFIIDFLRYTLNYAQFFIFECIIIVLLPLIIGNANKDKKLKLRIIGLIWFLIPLVIAYVYSLMKEPIIQFSTLCFSFPFVVIVAFSFYDRENTSFLEKIGVISVILFSGITSLVIDRQYYKQVYKQGFDQVAVEMKKNQQQYSDSINFVSYSDRSFMTKFYQDKEGITNNRFYDKESKITDYQNDISCLSSKYLGVGLTDYADLKWELSAIVYYPYLVDVKYWFTTKYLILSKGKTDNLLLKSIVKYKNIEKGKEWGPSYLLSSDTLDKNYDIGFIADIQSDDTISDIVFVVELRNKSDDSLLFWRGEDYEGEKFLPDKNHIFTNGIHADIYNIDYRDVMFKVYIWNREKKSLKINNIYYYQIKKDPYFFGLYDPLK